MAEPFAIAQVTPYTWEGGHEVNRFVSRTAGELAARGHRVIVIAPTASAGLVRDSRRAIRAATRDGGKSLLPAA
ncbi:MAG TPA: hypothetical protein VIM22_11815, partial [Solirubrobacteraceae bacterium]